MTMQNYYKLNNKSLRDFLIMFDGEYISNDDVYELGEIDGVYEANFWTEDKKEERYSVEIKFIDEFEAENSIICDTDEYMYELVNFE